MSALFGIMKAFRPGDYHISTWLIIGATLQCLLVAAIPRNIAIMPAIAPASLPNVARLSYRHWPLIEFPNIRYYTWSTDVEDTEESEQKQDSIVVLVLAATFTHPNGNFSPGGAEIGNYFAKMWKDAEDNCDAYGFLGNTPGLATDEYGSRPDQQGKTLVYLSYWKSLDGLHKFAHAKPHMAGQLWWERGAMEKHTHIGVMHETYEVPAGNWENVFHSFRPFGIAAAKFPVARLITDSEGNEQKDVEWVSGLQSANAKEWRTMHGRMGRKQAKIVS